MIALRKIDSVGWQSLKDWVEMMAGRACQARNDLAPVMENFVGVPSTSVTYWDREYTCAHEAAIEGTVEAAVKVLKLLEEAQASLPKGKAAAAMIRRIHESAPPDPIGLLTKIKLEAKTALELPAPERLYLDSLTQTVTLDGETISIENPKAFRLYKAIAEMAGKPITRRDIRAKYPNEFRGDKKIRNLLNSLPEALSDTVESGFNGYWLRLSPPK
jgi:hypothetical protein